MTSNSVRAHRRRPGPGAIFTLLILVAFGLVVETTPPAHFHTSEGPGIYNGDCVLAALAAFRGTVPLCSASASIGGELVASAVQPAAPACFSVPLVGHSDPRAPPLV